MNKELKFWMIVVAIVIILILCIVKLVYFSEDVEVMMREKIYGAVEVSGLADIAEGESLGRDNLVLDTAEQFLGLVPKGETIYTYFELGEKEPKFPSLGDAHYQLNRKFVYVANELRVIYNDSYEYQKGDRRYWIEGWSWGSAGLGRITFHYDNKGCIAIVVYVIVVIVFSIFIASGFKDMPWWMP
jgi:hypothetical protein